MAYIFHPDFRDFIAAFNQEKVDYVLLGGYAVILHGYSRTTGDLDIWVRRTRHNFRKIARAFRSFGMSRFEMTEKNFLHNDTVDVFTFGSPPVSIDIMIAAKGLDFDTTFEKAQWMQVKDLPVKVIHLADLIQQKKIIGRAKDQDDIDHLLTSN